MGQTFLELARAAAAAGGAVPTTNAPGSLAGQLREAAERLDAQASAGGGCRVNCHNFGKFLVLCTVP